MIYKKASQLHNEDEVRYKKTGETLRILQAYPELHPVTKKPCIRIEAVGAHNQFLRLTHKDIE